MNTKLNWLYDIKIAHRGLHNIEKGIPENTIAAFSKAIKNNVAIELDVHMLKDNSIIVFHDDDLKRCCNIDKKIKDLTLSEITKLQLFNTEHKTPTLIDALDYIDNQVPVIIEVKTDIKAKKICPYLLKVISSYKGNLAIKSFDPSVCLWFKNNAPEYIRGLLVSDLKNNKKYSYLKKFIVSKMILLPFCKPDFLSVKLSMLRNKKVKTWKANNRSYYRLDV